MVPRKKLKIVIVTAFYSEGMGYSENCLPRALARLGHEVHVIASVYNVYGNEPLYDETYKAFLGPSQMPIGSRTVDGYTLHRLESSLMFGYVHIKGLGAKIRELDPDIVHSLEVASLQTYFIGLIKPFTRFKLFTETHQTMSVMRPYMKHPDGQLLKRAIFRMTRTVPTALCCTGMELCYAVTPDCGEVAMRFYGVPKEKVRYLSLGSDTDTFHPIDGEAEQKERAALRARLGYTDDDIVCVYTGRFNDDKNPLVLAKAIDKMSETPANARYKGLFIGHGAQKPAIAACRNVQVVPFMTHRDLAAHYRAADIGVWPRRESMSMIDAASSGVPLVVNHTIGEPARVEGNGLMYQENDVEDLIRVLDSLRDAAMRQKLGAEGRRKMMQGFSWPAFAKTVEADFYAALDKAG